MAAIAGLRGTGDFATDERPKSFREYILWREPNGAAPLQALMARMRSEAVDDPEFSWWEEEQGPIRLQVNGAVTTAQTSVVVDSGDAQDLVAGDLLMVEKTEVQSGEYDNEIVEVASVTNATTFIVSRGAANTTAGTIADDSFVTRIGTVFAEGTTSPESSSRNPTKYLNYAQIFKKTYELTGTAAKPVKTRTGNPVTNDKKRAMFDHATDMEFAYFFGKPYETTGSNSKPKRFTGGLRHYLGAAKLADTTNAAHVVKIWTTTPTEDEVLDTAYKMWDFRGAETGSNERIGLCGNGFLNSLNKLARDSSSTRVNFDGTVQTYGMQLQRWVLPQGTLYLRTHPLFNLHGRFTNSAFFINPRAIVDRPYRKTRFKDNVQANDADTQKGQWMSEMGPEFHHMKTMSYFGNFVV
jgi:hypothetical protein